MHAMPLFGTGLPADPLLYKSRSVQRARNGMDCHMMGTLTHDGHPLFIWSGPD